MKSLLTRPFITLITKELQKEYEKVNKVLTLYAENRRTSVEKLHLLQICDESGELCPTLLNFLANMPPSNRQAPENLVKYKRQTKSRLRRLVKSILTKPGNSEDGPQFPVHLNVPPFLYPILHLIQRTGFGKRNRVPKEGEQLSKEEIKRRLNTPLTDSGRILLIALLIVIERDKLTTVASVMVDHALEVIAAIKTSCPPNKWHSTVHSFRRLRTKLGLQRIPKPPKQYIDIDCWPPTLKRQTEVFLKKSSSNLDLSDPLVKLAARFGIELKQLEARTRENYIKAVSKAIAIIPYNNNLNIIDLLTLTPIRRQVGEGRYTEELHNELIDIFREHERSLETDRKRQGYDSELFQTFITAVKTIAAFNDIVDLQESFKKAYRINTDKAKKKEVKAYKKRTYDLTWIDKEIVKLGDDFHRIIRVGTFKFENEAVSLKQRRRNLRFCTFYVVLITLRYMGYRQQCIRNCEVGKNIIFDKDGSITFHWTEDEVKNDKEITAKLNKRDHGLTHGLMIDALWSYYKHVYPYLKRRISQRGKGQFFLKMSTDQSVTAFVANDATSFGIQFKNWCLEFLHFGDRLTNTKRCFNPHHLRGLCLDWLVYILEMSLEEASQVIGDAVQTLGADYLDKTRPYDATLVLLRANRSIKAKIDGKRVEMLEGELKQHRSLLTQKESQLTSLIQELSSTNERLARAEAGRDSLAAQLEVQRTEIASFKEQSEHYHREMIRILKGNSGDSS